MSRFFNPKYKDLKPYVPGEQPQDHVYIKLNTNESPFPASPNTLAYAMEEAKRLHLYSDPTCAALVKKGAAYYGVAEEEILFTNGSDEALVFALLTFCKQEEGAVFADITYGFYSVICTFAQVPFTKIPLQEDLSIRPEDFYHLNKMIFLANPNAPTGMTLSVAQIEGILQNNPNQIVVVDEAYVDFGAQTVVPLIHRYENLLVVQTMSKSRSLAGGRLGVIMGNRELIADLNRLKYAHNPYNVNRMTMGAGIGAFEDEGYRKANCQTITSLRESVSKQLREMGFTLTDSHTNFVFAKHPQISGGDLYRELKKRYILVRYFDEPRLTEYVRITIGTSDEMQTLLLQIRDILENGVSV